MKTKTAQNIFEKNSHDKIIKTLSPYLTEHRKARIDSVVQHRLNTIALAIENPADINNALACVRTCEAFGISTVHIISPQHDARYIHPITQCAFYWIDIIFHESTELFLQTIQIENRVLAGAVIDAPNTLSAVPVNQPLCLLIGNEQRGLSTTAKNACDFLFSIPMCGMIDSLNLSVAAAVSLFDVSERKRAQLNTQSDLSTQTREALLAKYYLNSVNVRIAEQLLAT